MIIVNFYGATSAKGTYYGTFQRRFPDMATWEKVRAGLLWTYSKIEVIDQIKPVFHEYRDDHLIPEGYGIEESYDGGYYPYRIYHHTITHLKDAKGLDFRKATYEQALEHLAEIVD